MSLHTISRLPKDVAHIFRVYEYLSNQNRSVAEGAMGHFLHKSSPYYQMLNRRKLLNLQATPGPNYNAFDFPPLIRDLVANVFDGSVKFGDVAPKVQAEEQSEVVQPIFSEKGTTSRHFSNQQNKALHVLACAYAPYEQLPPTSSSQNSLLWYQRLLQATPVVFFLRQKQRLLAETSIQGLNFPLDSLRSGLAEISARYTQDSNINKRIRNYHLTDLTSTDIFGMALQDEAKTGEAFSEHPDKLASKLREYRLPQIIDGGGSPVAVESLGGKLGNEHSLESIAAQADHLPSISVKDIFPYDVLYDDLYILTIERSVFKDNHEDLLDLIERQSNIETVAIRMLSSNEFNLSSGEERVSGTYDELLQWAKTHGKKKSPNNFTLLMRRFGEWGFTNVEESTSGAALYLFKP